MDWQYTLIRLYLYLDDHYQAHLWVYAQRFSNNHRLRFCDAELLTIYLFGLMQQRRTLTSIYAYATGHLQAWFPHLPAYQTFVERLNRLADLLPVLTETILGEAELPGVRDEVKLIDSFPVILAQQRRSQRAQVAPELAQKSYCASKGLYYYGVNVHLVAARRPGQLPVPEAIALSPGAANDLSVMRHYLPYVSACAIFADKAYADARLQAGLEAAQGVVLHTPIKRQKGQARLALDQRLYSTAVSQVRQPIESLFNWINEKTGIEMASKVRSTKGLLVHVFGRLAAAMFLLAFNP